MKRSLSRRALIPSAAVFLLLLASGCSRLERRQAAIETRLAHESSALTGAVIDALELQPEKRRDAYTSAALRFARQDQRLEGLPLEPFDVPALLIHTNTSAETRARKRARRELESRFHLQENLLHQRERVRQSLITLGIEREREQNRARVFWAKFAAWTGGPAVILIALCVLFPAAIPIIARLLAWIAGRVPALAGALGVVSVKAFDAVIRGIERSKSSAPPPPPLANTTAVEPSSLTETLHAHLSREMDAAHKRLVRSRKAKISG